jgi:hypothetical protein
VTDIRPEYSFRDAQHKGAVNDFRPCSAGYQAAGQGQATESGAGHRIGGRSATVGSVNLITHADQTAGPNWPDDDE